MAQRVRQVTEALLKWAKGIAFTQRDKTITEIIILTGPESCGKTTLAKSLCDMLRAPLVPEASRDYLKHKMSRNRDFRYREADLLEIANQQQREEQLALTKAPDLLVCDTDLLVLIIWSEVRFGVCHQWILDTFANNIATQKRHYLLCDYDLPWQPDPLRENPDDREELFALYQQKLEHYQLEYSVMEGSVEQRTASAIDKLGGKFTTH